MQNSSSPLRQLARWIAATLLGAAFAPLAWAQQGESDPPGRVGRLSEVIGQVWLYSPDAGEWLAANRNRPLTAGERLSTDPGGRAEVRIGSTTLRLDSGSELEVLRLDDSTMQMQLHQGSLAVRLRNRDAVDEFELQTGEGRFRPQRTGRYRFDRFDDTSHLTVDNGQALYEGPQSALTVHSGQRAEFWIDAANSAQYSITEPRQDEFSAWNSERDRRDGRSASSRYVSPEMTGMEELDRYGRWETSDDYGAIWIPRQVASGWAPYSTGHWVWISPWGWTWVDEAPWGFAPFHYGRWVWYRNNWCWSPGRYERRPVYAPALVAWVGGPQLSVSVTIGGGRHGPSVGWFPLAPHEVYLPHYHVSPRYVRNINVTHVTNVTVIDNAIQRRGPPPDRDYRNRKFPHAVTVVPSSVISGRQPVAPAAAQWRHEVPRELVGVAAAAPVLRAPPVLAPAATPRAPDPRQRAEAGDDGSNSGRRWSHPVRRQAREPGEVAVAPATRSAAPPMAAPVTVAPERGSQPGFAPPAHQASSPGAGAPGQPRWQGPPRQTGAAPVQQASPAVPSTETMEPRIRVRPNPGQEGRTVRTAPQVPTPAATPGAPAQQPAPPQAVPRQRETERPAPERRNHGFRPDPRPPEPPAAKAPAPAPRAEAKAPEERGERGERGEKGERGERRGPRERAQMQ